MCAHKNFFLILFLSTLANISISQNIHYSVLFPNNRDNGYKVAGKIGNTYHVWKTSTNFNNTRRKVAVEILIFSSQMNLIDTKPISIDEEQANSVNFNFFILDSIYYAHVVYLYNGIVIKNQILKVDKMGNVVDFTLHKADLYMQLFANDYSINDDIIVGGINSIYSARIKVNMGANENNNPMQGAEMVIQKNDFYADKPLAEAHYSSEIFDFGSSKILLDSMKTLWVCASHRDLPKTIYKDSVTKHPFFLVHLDSNLNELFSGPKLIQLDSKNVNPKNIYSIEKLFMVNNQIFLISLGQKLTPQYYPYNPYYPNSIKKSYSYEIVSMRITQIDKSLNVLRDTVVDLNTKTIGSKLFPQNSFYSVYSNSVGFFCFQHFTHNMSGIKYFQISKNSIQASDLRVDPKNEYHLQQSKKINNNTYIIPFDHNSKTGFMKIEFEENTEN